MSERPSSARPAASTRTSATAREEQKVSRRAGLLIEQQLPRGILVSGAAHRFATLKRDGNWVKGLPDVNIPAVSSGASASSAVRVTDASRDDATLGQVEGRAAP